MRGLHLILLMALLCSDRALSLRCYICQDTHCQVSSCTGVCFKSDLVFTLAGGQKVKSYVSSCTPSCEFASNLLQKSVDTAKELSQLDPNLAKELSQLDPSLAKELGQPPDYKFEMQGFSCCESDLCNGVAQVGRSLWVLAGGLLLSLGPALLWTLL